MSRIGRYDDRPIKAIKTKAGEWFRCGPGEKWGYISVANLRDGVSMFSPQRTWFDINSRDGREFERINADSVARIVYVGFGNEY